MIHRRKTLAVILAVLVLLSAFPVFAETAEAPADAEAAIVPFPGTAPEAQPEDAAAPLTEYWAADSEAAEHLRSYVAKVTDENDPANYIPERDRIAVFDMDGTLTCETYYTYFDTMMFIEYCLHDHPEKVSDELKQVALSIEPGYKADEALARNFAKAYAGMTVNELHDYAVEFG